MRIVPLTKDYNAWEKLPPSRGDLVFFAEQDQALAASIGAPLLSAAEARACYWDLAARSWYGYALNRATSCVWLPKGQADCLPDSIREAQLRLGVPTLSEGRWTTAARWLRLSPKGKQQEWKRWFSRNQVVEHELVPPKTLSASARLTLEKSGALPDVNRFAPFSGPNCFAFTAACVAKNPALKNQWLHAEPFRRFLEQKGFSRAPGFAARPGDALLFFRESVLSHAAFSLGEGWATEKPGQDFYEPYRLGKLEEIRAHWSECEVWRARPRAGRG